jgi:hypothetical protein
MPQSKMIEVRIFRLPARGFEELKTPEADFGGLPVSKHHQSSATVYALVSAESMPLASVPMLLPSTR